MTRYLRKHGTNEIFVWTEYLAARPDMVPYEPPPAKVEANQKEDIDLADNGLKSFVPNPSDLINKTEDPPMVDPNRVALIMDAIATLQPEDFTKDGKPKIAALEIILGFAPTKMERDAAVEQAKSIVILPTGSGDDEEDAGGAQE